MSGFRKAERSRVKARIALAGPSGSGKTMSALLLAYGLVNDWNKIAMIDTEMGSGELYTGSKVEGLVIGQYQYCRIEPPYTVEKYIDTMRMAENSKEIEVVIIDSTSHAWAGSGGLLDRQGKIADASKSKNTWTAWRTITPLHNQFIDIMMQSRMHVIATLRSKAEYAQSTDANGRVKIEKLGMAPIQREGFEYEFTVFFDLDMHHIASASKDRTTIFDGQFEKISEKTGKRFLEWANTGIITPAKQINKPDENPSFVNVSEAEQKATKEAFNKAIDSPSPANRVEPPTTARSVPDPEASIPPAQEDQPPPSDIPRNPNCILPAQEKLIRSRIGKDFAKSDVERITNELKVAMKVEHLKDLLKTQMNAVMAWINTSAAELKEYTEELRKEEIEAAKTQS